MFTFMAGATTTGAVDAKYNVVRKSSAIPRANFAMTSAVAGAHKPKSVRPAPPAGSIALFMVPSLPLECPNQPPGDFFPVRPPQGRGPADPPAPPVLST